MLKCILDIEKNTVSNLIKELEVVISCFKSIAVWENIGHKNNFMQIKMDAWVAQI